MHGTFFISCDALFVLTFFYLRRIIIARRCRRTRDRFVVAVVVLVVVIFLLSRLVSLPWFLHVWYTYSRLHLCV